MGTITDLERRADEIHDRSQDLQNVLAVLSFAGVMLLFGGLLGGLVAAFLILS